MPRPKKKRDPDRPIQANDKEVTFHQEKFLAAFREYGNIIKTCEVLGMDTSHIFHLLDPDNEKYNSSFALLFEQAKKVAVERMVAEVERRAFQGVRRLKFTGRGQMIMMPDPTGKTEKIKRKIKGKGNKFEEVEVPVMVPYVEHEYSDTLAMFLLKAHDPNRFRDTSSLYIDGKLRNLNLNLNGANGTQLKTREELIEETEALLRELRGEQGRIGGNGSTNGHANGNVQ